MKAFAGILIAALLIMSQHSASVSARPTQQDEGAITQRVDSGFVARKLSSQNPNERREAAEELARMAAVEHRRLVEGYRVQEKDSRVRLALDWALYRMGKNESLFPLVRALDSKKGAEQSIAYLKQLETPDPLYVFLKNVNGNTQIRLLDVLAAVGDGGTLERIKPFTESLDPGIADAARFAEGEINTRLQNAPTVEPKRQRRVGSGSDTGPR
ncbi:MAG: hypothetical protein H7Z38_22825 [Rubrivivax sp.]|nr:hypothetical protein [Pyrinomonadaceae bacterium]